MSGRARSTSTLTRLAMTFCPPTTSTRNTSIDARRQAPELDSATTAAATTMTTTRAPELRDRAQHRRGEVGRVGRAPRREAAIDAREAGVARAPSRTGRRPRPRRRRRRPAQRSAAVRSRPADRRARARTCAPSHGPRPRGGRPQWSRAARPDPRPASGATAADDGRAGAPARRPPGRARPPSRGLPNVESVKPKCMQTPSTAAGAVGVASQPTRARPCIASPMPTVARAATGSIPNRADRLSIWPSDSTAITRLSSRR